MGLLDGKVAIVTGGGRGIGRAHALELARQGAKVVVNDLGCSLGGDGAGPDADLTVELLRSRDAEAVADYGDIAHYAQAQALMELAIATYGQLDILVNNAGIVRDAAIWNMTEEDFDSVVRVHLKGTWALCHHAARHWRDRFKAGDAVNARIINTVSGAGLVGNFGQSNYAPAKAAIASLTQTLSLELRRIGVTVNAVAPGAATRMIASTGAMAPVEADDVAEHEWNPLNPAVSSPVVAWLASDEARHITGQVFRVVGEEINWMQGWTKGPTITNGNRPWKAESLGDLFGMGVFGTAASGMQPIPTAANTAQSQDDR